MDIFKKLAWAIIKKSLRKQGLTEHWGWGYTEYGEPYRHIPASHAMGVGGIGTEGKFLVPDKPVNYIDAPDGKYEVGGMKTIYDKDILSPKRTYSVDDEIESLISQLFRKRGRKKD